MPPLTAQASASERMVLTQRAGDDVARVAQPDELLGRQRQRIWEKCIQARVNARQRDDRQFVREIRRMQSGARVTGHRPVVRVNDGFEEAHINSRFNTFIIFPACRNYKLGPQLTSPKRVQFLAIVADLSLTNT